MARDPAIVAAAKRVPGRPLATATAGSPEREVRRMIPSGSMQKIWSAPTAQGGEETLVGGSSLTTRPGEGCRSGGRLSRDIVGTPPLFTMSSTADPVATSVAAPVHGCCTGPRISRHPLTPASKETAAPVTGTGEVEFRETSGGEASETPGPGDESMAIVRGKGARSLFFEHACRCEHKGARRRNTRQRTRARAAGPWGAASARKGAVLRRSMLATPSHRRELGRTRAVPLRYPSWNDE
jgi:hypothetical protein